MASFSCIKQRCEKKHQQNAASQKNTKQLKSLRASGRWQKIKYTMYRNACISHHRQHYSSNTFNACNTIMIENYDPPEVNGKWLFKRIVSYCCFKLFVQILCQQWKASRIRTLHHRCEFPNEATLVWLIQSEARKWSGEQIPFTFHFILFYFILLQSEQHTQRERDTDQTINNDKIVWLKIGGNVSGMNRMPNQTFGV